MRHETAFRFTNSRYHANLSCDRVFVRRRCNGSIFPWRSVAHYWAKEGTNHDSEAKCFAAWPEFTRRGEWRANAHAREEFRSSEFRRDPFPHFPILSAPKQSPWKLLAQFSLSRERDVANIIA